MATGATLSSLLERRGRLAVALDANHSLETSLNEALEDLPRCLAELSRVESVLDLADEMHNHDVAQRSLVQAQQPTHSQSLPLLPQDLPIIHKVHEELRDLREATCLSPWTKGDDAALARCVESECKRLAAYHAARQRMSDPLGFVASLDANALAQYALDVDDGSDDYDDGPRRLDFDWESIASRIAPTNSLPVHSATSCRTRWIMALQPARAETGAVANWTPHEERRLRQVVAAQGDSIDWHSVATQLNNGRQAHDCLQAYCRLLPDEDDRSTAASQDHTALDDDEILRHVSIFGFEWAIIAERTRRRRHTVKDRFRRALTNTKVKGTWSSDELDRLGEAILEQQDQQEDLRDTTINDDKGFDADKIDWLAVSQAVTTRSPDQCRARWSQRGVRLVPAKSQKLSAVPAKARAKRQKKGRAGRVLWTDDEDQRLRDAMRRSEQDEQQQQQVSQGEGPGQWSWPQIADFVGERADWQARLRWKWLQQNEADWLAGGAKKRSVSSARKGQGTEATDGGDDEQFEEEEEDEAHEGGDDGGGNAEEQAQDAAEQRAVAATLLPPTRSGRKRKTPQRDAADYLTARAGASTSVSMSSRRRSTRRKLSS